MSFSVFPEFEHEPSKPHQCIWTNADGVRCRSYAMHNKYTCFHHVIPDMPDVFSNDAFPLDRPETRDSIQSAIADILVRIAANQMDLKRASSLLYGLQIASTNLTAKEKVQAAAAAIVPEAPQNEASPQPTANNPQPATVPTPQAPKKLYTDEEKDFLKAATTTLAYAPAQRLRPESITDDDIIGAINANRRLLRLKPVQTEPAWNRATLSARPALTTAPQHPQDGPQTSAQPVSAGTTPGSDPPQPLTLTAAASDHSLTTYHLPLTTDHLPLTTSPHRSRNSASPATIPPDAQSRQDRPARSRNTAPPAPPAAVPSRAPGYECRCRPAPAPPGSNARARDSRPAR
jgi:hypothetical protein